jgi:alpha-N-acetylgalactosaminidase
MGIWAILAAPLLMSNDLRNIKDEYKNILLNKEVIDVNQDKMAIPGKRVYHSHLLDIWIRPILPKTTIGGKTFTSFAIALVNRKHTKSPLSVKVNRLKDLGLTSTYLFRELFDHIDVGLFSNNDQFIVSIPSTGIRLYKTQIKL